MKRPSLLAVGLLLCSCGLASAAMVVQGYNPANHDRFYVGADKAFIGDPYNWSGVGVNGFASWATMISPDYFISANHSHPADGSTLTFYYSNDPNGGYETATVDSGQYIGDADVWLGKLSAPVSSNVAKYPVLSLPSLSAYVGLTVNTFGLSNSSIASQNQRLGRNVITVDTAAVFEYNYDAPGLGADESLATSGDSGAPAFVVVGGTPALVGTVWFGNQTTYVGDSFVSGYIGQINAAMVGEQATTISVPEPCTLDMLALGAIGVFVWKGWRKRK